MPGLGVLRVWVLTATGVPLSAVAPVMVTEIPVRDVWFATAPPLVRVSEVVPTAMIPAGLETLNEKVPEPGLLLASPG